MKILSVTTSSSICSVCLLDNDNIIKELSLDNAKTHSENLIHLLIDQLLKETNTFLGDIDYIACDIGPRLFYWN